MGSMQRLVKIIVLSVTGLMGVVIVAALSLLFFFDPNDFKDRITSTVKTSIGRDLALGDMELAVFPWLAVQIGPTELANVEGFSDEAFLSFDEASLSVSFMALILRREIQVGKAALYGLEVNLEVDRNGMTNWSDLAGESAESASDGGVVPDFDVAKVVLTNARISYDDAAAGSRYVVQNLSFETGRITVDAPFDISGEFNIESVFEELSGHVALHTTVTMPETAAELILESVHVSGAVVGPLPKPIEFEFGTEKVNLDLQGQRISPGDIELKVLGVGINASFEPFSYADRPEPQVEIKVADFSAKELLRKLEMETSVMADPTSLQHLAMSARAVVGVNNLELSNVLVDLDDSRITGTLDLSMVAAEPTIFDLRVDTISLDRYLMSPDENSTEVDETGDIKIPTDLIRSINVDGSLSIQKFVLAGLEASNLEFKINNTGGELRVEPIAAGLYDGRYFGELTIDASKNIPLLITNQRIEGVNVGLMMKAVGDIDDLSGTVNGNLQAQSAGFTVSAITEDLAGSVLVELVDGAWEGTDIWHQLRVARAIFRQEVPPEPTLPARTEFISVKATGDIADGVFTNNDFLAILPFLQLAGSGTVDLNTTEIDYSLEVNVVERPDLVAGNWGRDFADFKDTVVPLKITGSLESPNVRPDMEGIFRARVEETIDETKEKLRDRLLRRLLGSDESDEESTGEEGDEEDSLKKLGKDLLKKLFNN